MLGRSFKPSGRTCAFWGLALLVSLLPNQGVHAQEVCPRPVDAHISHINIPAPPGPELAQAGGAGVETGVREAPDWLDTTRARTYQATYWFVKSVDSWFGDKPFEESGGQVDGSLYFRGLYREDQGIRSNLRFRLKVDMPNVSERAYLFLGRANEQELLDDRPDTFTRSQLLLPDDNKEDQTYFVGLAYALREALSFRVGVRGGYKLYTQLRYYHLWRLGQQSHLEFSQTLFLAVSDGLGTTSSASFSAPLSESRRVRWRNTGTISTETDGVDWSSALGIVQNLPQQSQLALDLLANGQSDAKIGVREFGVRGVYRRPVWKEWLVGELIVGHFWPRDDNDPVRGESWAVGGGVEMFF